jgi:hypothetical protein
VALTPRASVTVGGNASGATATVTRPTGVVAGDLLVALCACDPDGAVTALTAPAGWAQSGTDVAPAGSPRFRLFTKVATGAEPTSYLFGTPDAATSDAVVAVSAWPNATGIQVVPAAQSATSGTAVTAPTRTATGPGALVAVFLGASAGSFGQSTGMTEFVDSAPNGWTVVAADYLNVAAGATGAKSATHSITSEWTGVSFVINEGIIKSATDTGAGSDTADVRESFTWSGHTWTKRPGVGQPGPNTWGTTSSSIALSGSDLVLTLQQVGGVWTSAEVDRVGPNLGYGRYRWTYDLDVANLDQRPVLGLYVYDQDPSSAPSQREIDIEITKWNAATETSTMWYSVHPVAAGEHRQGDHPQSAVGPYTAEFVWQPGQVYLRTVDGNGVLLGEHVVTEGVQAPGTEQPSMNLWLVDGLAPVNGQPLTATIHSFDFTPAVTHSLVKANTLSGSFDTPWQWAAKDGASVTGGELVLPCTPSYTAAYSGSVFDLRESSAQIEIAGIPTPAGNFSQESLWYLRHDADNYLAMFVSGGSFVARLRQAGVNTDVALGTHDPVTHRYWRIGLSGSAVTFQTSPDGGTWTTLGTATTSLTSQQLSTLRMRLECGSWAAETSPSPLRVTSYGVVATPVSATDSGAGSDVASVGMPRPSSDSGSGADQVTATARPAGTDARAGADTLGTTAALNLGTQTGAGTEQGRIIIPAPDASQSSPATVQLTGYPFKTEPGVGADGATVETLFGDLVVSLWAVHPTSGALVALPDFTRLTLSPQRNSAGSISLDYPAEGLNFDLLRNTITGDRDLEVEIWSIGSTTKALRGYLQEASGDDVAEGKTWTFAGGFLELRMGEAVVFPQPLTGVTSLGAEVQVDHGSIPQAKWDQLLALGYTGRANDGAERLYVPQLVLNAVLAGQPVPVLSDPKRELKFSAVTPGELVGFIMTQARARGTLTDIEWDFTASKDSEGNTWPNVLSTKFSPGASYDAILNRLVDLGLAEWSVEWDGSRKILRLWVPEGRGTDLTVGARPVVLRRGRNLIEAPRKWSVRDSATAVLAAGSEGVYENTSDADAQTRRGRRIEVSASANNLQQSSAVQAFAQAQMAAVKVGLLEVTHGLGFLPGEPRPLIAFDVGDWVYSQVGTSMERLRVVQWTLTVDAGQNPSGTVTLNDTVQDALVRLQKRLNALTSGDTVVGTSEESQQQDTGVPSAPEGVVVGSTAYLVDGVAHSLVTVGWNAVTTNTDGTAASDLQGYKVQFSYDAGGGWVGAEDVGANSNTSTFDASPGVQLKARVAAYDRNGNVSAWSAEMSHTTEDDTTPPPVPSTPVVSNYLGVLKIAWDGNSAAGTEMKLAAPDFEWCEVHLSAGSNFTPSPTTQVGLLYARGTYVVADLPYGTTQYARLVAVDTRGNASAPSAQGSDTPQQVVSQDVFDGAIGTAKLADAAITTAKINDLAVNDAKIGNLSVGKLTAGTFSASMTLSGIIRTNTTGSRVELDDAGLRLYNTSGTMTVRLQTSDGSALVTGTYQSGLTGERVNILPDGTFRIYPSTGTDYAQMSNTGGTFRFRSIADGSGRRSYVDLLTTGLTTYYQQSDGSVRSRFFQNSTYSVLEAPVTGIRVYNGLTPTDGSTKRFHFVFTTTTDSSGDIGTSALHYQLRGSGRNDPWLVAPIRGCGIVWDQDSISITNGIATAYGNIGAAAFLTDSSSVVKTAPRAPAFAGGRQQVSAGRVTQLARGREWRYLDEGKRPEKPDYWHTRVDDDGHEYKEQAEWPAPAPTQRKHWGPIAEDLQAIDPNLVVPHPTTGVLRTDLRDLIGVLWIASGEHQDQLDEFAERLARVEARLFPEPQIVDGEIT